MSKKNEWIRNYRLIDAIYRVHRNCFEIQALLAADSLARIKLARANSVGVTGTGIAALVSLIPVLLTLGDLAWGSPPLITVYILIAVLGLILCYQMHEASALKKTLGRLESGITPEDLENQEDFAFEEVNSRVVRFGVIAEILRELSMEISQAAEGSKDRPELEAMLARWQVASNDCVARVETIVGNSARLVEEGKRAPSSHKTLVAWCAAMKRPPSTTEDRQSR